MRPTPYDPRHDTCATCVAWFRYGLSSDGKALGYCRITSPRVFAFRHLIPGPTSSQVGVQEAQITVWPSTSAEQSCYEHVKDLSKLT